MHTGIRLGLLGTEDTSGIPEGCGTLGCFVTGVGVIGSSTLSVSGTSIFPWHCSGCGLNSQQDGPVATSDVITEGGANTFQM